MNKIKTRKNLFLLSVILLISALFRFYKLSSLFHWTMDEEYWSYLPFNIATGYHFPLIGGHISGTGLYSGPIFVWLMAFPFWIFRGNPLGIAFFVSLMGVISTATIYWVAKTLFSQKTAIVASFLQASSFISVLYDRKYWNASFIPLYSLLTILCLFKVIKGKIKWSIPLAFLLSIAFHSHMASGVLLLSSVIILAVFKLPIRKKQILFSICLFLMLQLPLVFFDLRHNFVNTKAFLNLKSTSSEKTSFTQAIEEVTVLFINTTSRIIYMPNNIDIANELTLCKQYSQKRYIPQQLFGIGILGLILVWLIKKREKNNYKLLAIILGVNYFSLIFYRYIAASGNWYPGQLSEYFFLPVFPIVILLLAEIFIITASRFSIETWIMLTILGIFFLIHTTAMLTAKHSDSFQKKLTAITDILDEVGNSSFSLKVKSQDQCRIYGYRYLFSYFKKEPLTSYMDNNFRWLYQERIQKKELEKIVTIIPSLEKTQIIVKDT